MLEKGTISNRELTLLVIGFILGSSVILTPAAFAGHEAWLATLVGLAESLVFVIIYLTLLAKFPGKNIVQINDIAYGPYLGKLISFLYLWYFLHLCSLVFRNFGDFFSIIMPETPMPVFLVLLLIVSAWAVRSGIEVIARCSCVLVALVMGLIILSTLLLVNKMDASNLMPLLSQPVMNYVLASHSAATFPFGETIAFTMVIFAAKKSAKSNKYVIKGLIIAGLLLILIALRNITVLGNTHVISTYPSFDAVRLINVGEIINRLEIIVAIDFLTMGFLKICILYYATVLGMAQILKLKTYSPIVLPTGIIIVSMSVLQFNNVIENIEFAYNIYPYYSSVFEFILPLVSLAIVKLKGY